MVGTDGSVASVRALNGPEVLARAVENHALRGDSAAELVNLFEEARFSPHVMSEAHRESALSMLQLVLADLRSLV